LKPKKKGEGEIARERRLPIREFREINTLGRSLKKVTRPIAQRTRVGEKRKEKNLSREKLCNSKRGGRLSTKELSRKSGGYRHISHTGLVG